MTINGGGKLLGNVSAEMVIITENGSIKGDVACKMLKVGFEASIIGRVYVHLTATSGSKIVVKEESLSIIENGYNEMRGASRPSSDRAEPIRDGLESNVKEGLPSLKVMTPTGKDKKVKEIKDIRNMRHMDIKTERLWGTEENSNKLSEENFQDPCRPIATALQPPSDSSKLQYKEVEKLSVLKDQVEGLIESERVRGREREREKEKEQSTIFDYHDRSIIKIEDEEANESKNENENGKQSVAKELKEAEKEEETGNRKEEIERGRYDMEERRKEDMSVKEMKRTKNEKENVKTDRQLHEERSAKRIIEEKSMREVTMKTDGKRDTVEKEIEQVGREEQRVTSMIVSTNGRDGDASAHNVKRVCVGASTQEGGEGEVEGKGEREGRERTVENISNRERIDDGVDREVEQKVRLGRLTSSERTADTAEKEGKVDSFRRIEREEKALREKEVGGLELFAVEAEKDKKGQNMSNMDIKTWGSEERSKEEMERSDRCVDNKEAVSSKHQICKEELKTGSGHKRSEKTRMQDKKERKKSRVPSDVLKGDSFSREDRHHSASAGAGAAAGDLHSVGASPSVRKASGDISSRSGHTPAQGQGGGGGGVGVEAADQRVPEESHPEKGKKEIREERRRLSKFISQATVDNGVVDRERAAQEAMQSEREMERVREVEKEREGEVEREVMTSEVEREIEIEGVADKESDAGNIEANNVTNLVDERDIEHVTLEDEDGEDDSLEDRNQQHMRSVKIKGGTTSRPGSHILALVK